MPRTRGARDREAARAITSTWRPKKSNQPLNPNGGGATWRPIGHKAVQYVPEGNSNMEMRQMGDNPRQQRLTAEQQGNVEFQRIHPDNPRQFRVRPGRPRVQGAGAGSSRPPPQSGPVAPPQAHPRYSRAAAKKRARARDETKVDEPEDGKRMRSSKKSKAAAKQSKAIGKTTAAGLPHKDRNKPDDDGDDLSNYT
jgi:hypothetical protein